MATNIIGKYPATVSIVLTSGLTLFKYNVREAYIRDDGIHLVYMSGSRETVPDVETYDVEEET